MCLTLLQSSGEANQSLVRVESMSAPRLRSLDYVGEGYISFLRQTCKPYQVLPSCEGFNLSMVELDASRFLFCVRMLGTVPAFFGEEVVPGNFSSRGEFMAARGFQMEVPVGKNFVWNNWGETLIDNTVFFVGTFTSGSGIVVDKAVQPAVLSSSAISSVHKTTHGDVRLARCGGTIYAYDAYLTSMYTVHVTKDRVITMFDIHRSGIKGSGVDTTKTFSRHFICEQDRKKLGIHSSVPQADEEANVKTNFDKNWALIWTERAKRFRFLKWWIHGEVLGVDVVVSAEAITCEQKSLLKMEGDRLLGRRGSKTLPMMSLGSPMAELPAQEGERFRGIACGHAKINRTAPYESAGLSEFRSKVRELVSGDAGSYIEHNSFMYMPFLLLYVEHTNGRKKLCISDVFFPYKRSGRKRKYNFSLMYPMSVVVRGPDLLISGGIGDYYTFVATLSLRSAVDACRHDVRKFDASKLEYLILETK